jgi:hypothetical protein
MPSSASRAKAKARGLDEHDAEAKGNEQLVLVGPAVEGSHHDPLHHHAKQHDEQGTGDDGDDERAAVGIGDPAGERAEHEAVEALRYEGGPVDHVVARVGEERPDVMAGFDPAGQLSWH